MTDHTSRAAKTIRSISDLPWVDANERWGHNGVQIPTVKLIYPITRKGKRRHGGVKDVRHDVFRAVQCVGRAVTGRRNRALGGMSRRWSTGDGYWRRFRHELFMAWFWLFQSNELDSPDAVVTGTTLYGVWGEEAEHAALWSPEVALAIADWLEHAREDDERAAAVADMIARQADRLRTGRD